MRLLAFVALASTVLVTGCSSKKGYNSADTERVVLNARASAYKDDKGFILVPPEQRMFCSWQVHGGSGWFRRGNEDLQFIEEPCADTKFRLPRGASDSSYEFAMAELMRRGKVVACNAQILSTGPGSKLQFLHGNSSVAKAKWLADTTYRSMTINLGRKRPDGSREATADIDMSWSWSDKYFVNTKHFVRGTCEFSP